MKIAVLVTTMHQTDLSKYSAMNLHTDAVIANQTQNNDIIDTMMEGHHVKLVSTSTVGVSRNRNIAVVHTPQDDDIIVFSDDDLVFNDDYAESIKKEFDAHPKAEAIKFNLHDLSEVRKISMRRIEKFERATHRNMSSSGVCGLAVKTQVINKYRLVFDERFGPGTDHPNGEDTIFLMKMLDNGVKFFRSPVDIAGINQETSSWFSGHNEKFFETSGMAISVIYPRLSRLIVLRSAFKFSKRQDCDMSFLQILKSYNKGISDNRR